MEKFKLVEAVRAPIKTIVIEERNEYPDARITIDSGEVVNTDIVTISVVIKDSKGKIKGDTKVVDYKFAGNVPSDKEILGAISISFVESSKPVKYEEPIAELEDIKVIGK